VEYFSFLVLATDPKINPIGPKIIGKNRNATAPNIIALEEKALLPPLSRLIELNPCELEFAPQFPQNWELFNAVPQFLQNIHLPFHC